ncbi:MAG: DHH family phosphoesterase [Candidatus Aenigmarchaeota archaeon]|nr:DHH family phosphoesterase [Candidatus Aenigmarchaeota archaeon]
MRQDALEFLKNLKPEDNVKVFSHVDADGICSLALLIRFMRAREVVPPDKLPVYQLTDVPPLFIDPAKNMIFMDLNSDTIFDYLTETTLLVDHHIFEKKPTCVFYNPRETEPEAYLPAAYLMYDLCSELEFMENSKWIAAVGIIGDKGELNSQVCRDFLKSFDDHEKLQRVADFIYSVFLVDGNVGNEKMVEALLSARSPEDILDNPYFRYCYDEVQGEVSGSVKKMEKDGIFRFIETKSKYNIKSIVAAQALDREKGIIVIAYSYNDEHAKMSLRTDTIVNLGKITKLAAEKVGGSGGGHEKAAGARVPRSRFSAFKEELILGVENETQSS